MGERKREEGFVNTIFKNELGQEKCEELWSNDLKPANKVTATSYLNSKRIGKWKGEGAGKGGSCYILDDIQDREQDPLLTVRKCDAIFGDVPFISNVRKMKSEQATTVVQADACVFDIDPKKKNVGDLNKFWEGIAAKDECIQANAYIIAIFEQLTKEKLDALSLLASLKAENARLAGAKTKLLSDISVLGANIATSNVIYNDLIVKNGVYTNELIKLRNDFGQNKTDYFNKSNVSVAYLKSCDVFVQQLTAASQSLDYQIADSVQKYTEQRTLYDNLKNEYNSYVTSKEKLDSDLTVLVGENERNKKDYQQVVTDLRVCRGALEGVDRQVASLSAEFDDYKKRNAVVLESLGKCKVFLADCQIKSATCSKTCGLLTNGIINYNKAIAEYNKLISQCGSRNAALVQTMSNMNVYFDWVRSVYIYLSCDGFDLTLKKNQQSLDLLQTQCKDADTYIANTMTNVANTYNASQSNAKNDLKVCETDVAGIRSDVNNRIFPENIYISGDLRLACPPGEICPARNKTEALAIGQTVCSIEVPGSYYTEKWLNYDGQRGGIYCSYYGSSKRAATVGASNKLFQRNAGNVLPAGTYSNTLTGCKAANYILSCANAAPYNFRNCASNIHYVNNALSCRPDGYDHLVNQIAICDPGQTCTFADPKDLTTSDMDNLNSMCTQYIKPPMVSDGSYNIKVYDNFMKSRIVIDTSSKLMGASHFKVGTQTLEITEKSSITIETKEFPIYASASDALSGSLLVNKDVLPELLNNNFVITNPTNGKQSRVITCNRIIKQTNIETYKLPIIHNSRLGIIIHKYSSADLVNLTAGIYASYRVKQIIEKKNDTTFWYLNDGRESKFQTKGITNIDTYISLLLRPYRGDKTKSQEEYQKITTKLQDKGITNDNAIAILCYDEVPQTDILSILFLNELDYISNAYNESPLAYKKEYTNPIYKIALYGENNGWRDSSLKTIKVSKTTPMNFGDMSIVPTNMGLYTYNVIKYKPEQTIALGNVTVQTLLKPQAVELQASGDTIALHDGRKGAYCTYWGLSNVQTEAVAYNRDIEKRAYNIYNK